MYRVPKLTDYSSAAIDAAARALLSALDSEAVTLTSEADWKIFRDRWMARKNGVLTQLNEQWLKAAPGRCQARRRPARQRAESSSGSRDRLRARAPEARRLVRPTRLGCLDITLPGIRRPLGVEHPVIRTMNEIVAVFRNLGYSVSEGPEIETDYYNFESLNFPPNHPARDTQDTLFIADQDNKALRDRLLLRTHTSPVQIRTMERLKPPLRIVIPGKVHRNDPPDASHSPMFHQIEGLAVDTNITFGDLKGTLDHAMKALFGSRVKTQFPSVVLPLHRTQRRDDGELLHLRRKRKARQRAVPSVQDQRMDRNSRLRHGRPERIRVRETQRLRLEESLRLRLRHGRGPDRDLEVRRG